MVDEKTDLLCPGAYKLNCKKFVSHYDYYRSSPKRYCPDCKKIIVERNAQAPREKELQAAKERRENIEQNVESVNVDGLLQPINVLSEIQMSIGEDDDERRLKENIVEHSGESGMYIVTFNVPVLSHKI